jgi:hypothetical protein
MFWLQMTGIYKQIDNFASQTSETINLGLLSILKGPTSQIRSARGWYQWIGLSKDMPRCRFSFIFYIDIEFFKGFGS